MNSFTRLLPISKQWRCFPATSLSGSSAQKITSVSTDKCLLNFKVYPTWVLLLHQQSGLHVLAVTEGSSGVLADNLNYSLKSCFHTSSCLSVQQQIKAGIEDCYSLLGVERDCSDKDLKEAYLEKAKAYHPDSASATSDPYRFSQVKDAYKTVVEYRKGREITEEEEKEGEIIFDIKHTAPQHRQYLEFEGVGSGTPSQRQRQYQQHRVARVTENVFQHRIQRLASETEDALVVKDKQQAKKAVISNAMDRIVEDLIQESMKRGDFNNLAGQGQPLAYSAHNPFVDVTTHNLNKILVNNGFAPEWIMLQSEIRKEILQARHMLAVACNKLVQDAETKENAKMWTASLSKFKHQVSEVNIKINKFNLIVPFLNKQIVPYVAEREVKRVVENVQDYLPKEDNTYLAWDVSISQQMSLSEFRQAEKNIDWRQVWRDIKSVFKSSPEEQTLKD